jgi:hypothetical protein
MDGTEAGMWAGECPHGFDYLTDDGFRCDRCRHVFVSFPAGADAKYDQDIDAMPLCTY